MKVSVTQEDIKSGKPNSAYFCPVAYATKRAFGEEPISKNVSVGSDMVHHFVPRDGGGERAVSWRHPESVREFIFAFDNRKTVEPFEFELEEKEYS